MAFKVEKLDHAHVFVRDRYEAARWYERVLGLDILPAHEHWAADADGPLTISSDAGDTALALFRSDGRRRPRVIAFRVDGAGFLEFLARLDTHPVYDESGRAIGPDDVSDHGAAFSVYFCDPDGNHFELTTYDHDFVRTRLAPTPEKPARPPRTRRPR